MAAGEKPGAERFPKLNLVSFKKVREVSGRDRLAAVIDAIEFRVRSSSEARSAQLSSRLFKKKEHPHFSRRKAVQTSQKRLLQLPDSFLPFITSEVRFWLLRSGSIQGMGG